jgi:hypothetical protein
MKNTIITLLKGFAYLWLAGAVIFTIYSFAIIVFRAPSVGEGFVEALTNWIGYVLLFAPAGAALVLVEQLQGSAKK